MSKRLFVSVDLDGLADEVSAVLELFEGASGLNFVDPEQAHVTLKFLGDTGEDRVPELIDELERAVETADVDPFPAQFGGLGVFPSLEYISVVWLGVREGGDQLTTLYEAIEDRTVAMGFDPEDHDFTPHVTLARMNHAGGKELVQDVVEQRDPDAGSLRVEDVRLTESVLTDDGPVYSTLESFEL
ncbi:RNA 2',3'-cyclic phosphodiesterase [Halapricum hydrolyticum]|uniref:RNA 2',3'-cyclic phosphodiesterase n=1 Tax=Halapricum hydrolyticum TaxID=2979991 RepID=A0AAE3IA21_9EURY|nr:RNA 2',3'-cyclic phosphodiesterase [Halapricum hydrolyticum]MCU4717335.1 RNA 2',3'-cyclic phosphodiesterase [Halapricum hydrolyticum]MCU4726262.1 RNA 2',3'-cyclic phosphodiesterase [Halapricum hydrolyticum]